MLIAKLETPVTKVYQHDSLKTTVVNCHHFFAYAKNYGIGKNEIDFEVRFGNLELKETKVPVGIDVNEFSKDNLRPVQEVFDTVIRTSQILTLDVDLKDWTNDDSHVLDVIAKKFELKIVEKIAKDFVIPY